MKRAISKVIIRRSRYTNDWECQAYVIRNGIPTRWPSLDRLADDMPEAIKLRDNMLNGD